MERRAVLRRLPRLGSLEAADLEAKVALRRPRYRPNGQEDGGKERHFGRHKGTLPGV